MGKREHIRKRAFRLFIEHGLSDVSINDIISNLNITKGCFYYYYSNKDELIEDVFDYYVQAYFKQILKTIAVADNNPREKLLRFYIDLVSYDDFLAFSRKEEPVSQEQFLYLLAEATKKYHYIAEARRQFLAEARGKVKKLLDEGVSKGLVRDDVDTDRYAVKLITHSECCTAILLLFKDTEVKNAAMESFNEMWQAISA